jgi:cytochrome c
MKKSITAALAVGLVVGAGAALSQSADDLLKSKGCLGCHDFDKKKVGPAYKDVAAKYKGDAQAEGMLVAKLKEGKGHMKINASEAEIKTLVGRVLATK